MGSRNDLEQVLRDIRVFLSNGREYEKDVDCVVVNKKEAYELLSRFMEVLEEIKEDYELTKQGREQAEREARRRGEYIVKKANVKAEDVYAASVLYTDDALSRVQDLMEEAAVQMEETMKEFARKLKQNREQVRDNQSELKAQLRNMEDTQKYLHMMDEENRRRELEKARKEQEGSDKVKPIQNEGSIYAKPEIKINRAYFEEHGLAIPEQQADAAEPQEETKQYEAPEIRVNLDSEYFKWKEQQENGEQTPKSGKQRSSSVQRSRRGAEEDGLYDEDDAADWEPKKKGKFFFGKK